MASEDRKARKLRLRHRALQQTSGNISSNEAAQASGYCFQDSPNYQYGEPGDQSTQESLGASQSGNAQPRLTGNIKIDSFDDSQWRSMLEQLPGIHFQGDDPWYLALKKDPVTKKYYRQWERVPIIRPQDQTRYRAYKQRKRKDLDKTKKYVVWPEHVERAFEIGIVLR